MADFVASATRWYESALAQGDPRVKNWWLMSSPLQPLALIVAYLVVIPTLVLFMKKREAYSMKTYSLFHNIVLTSLSFYMGAEAIRQAVRLGYGLWRNPLVTDERGYEMARIVWIYYLSKILEFDDTVIMALKKNNHQISFLHVYHHTSIFFIWWVITYYAPGGESYFSVILNSFVHVAMYGYYLWASFAPKPDPTKRPHWTQPAYWKEYITRSQMVQFMAMLTQASYDLITGVPGYPRFCIWILFYYMFTMLGLFGNFYLRAYCSKGKKGKKDDAANGKGATKKTE